MILSELIATLRAEGIEAKAHQVHHAISEGYLPRPRVSGGRFEYRTTDLKAARKYLANPPKSGRRKKEATP